MPAVSALKGPVVTGTGPRGAKRWRHAGGPWCYGDPPLGLDTAQPKIPSAKELHRFLEKVVPSLVYTFIVRAHSLKACSGISPAFERVAAKYGLNAPVVNDPQRSHVYNVVRTKDGIYKVDLSAIQFTHRDRIRALEKAHPHVDHDDLHDMALDAILSEVRKNPFSAVHVERTSEHAVRKKDRSPVTNNAMLLFRGGERALARAKAGKPYIVDRGRIEDVMEVADDSHIRRALGMK